MVVTWQIVFDLDSMRFEIFERIWCSVDVES